jgi:hypothetical protein
MTSGLGEIYERSEDSGESSRRAVEVEHVNGYQGKPMKSDNIV